MAEITNEEIMRELIEQKTLLSMVWEQAQKTNGRVNTLEEWMNGVRAVEKYKQENASVIARNVAATTPNGWKTSDKLIAAAAGLIVATSVAINRLVEFLISKFS